MGESRNCTLSQPRSMERYTERYTCPGEAHLGDSQNRLAREAGSAQSGGILPDCQACKASLMFPRESFGTVSHLGTDSIIFVDYL